MVMEIVLSAIARKMLCHPVNNLIAASELVCSAGVMAKRIGMSFEEAERIAGLSDTGAVQQELVTIFAGQDLTGFEESYQNLAEMIREYRGEAVAFSEEYHELFWYSYKESLPLSVSKMNL